MPILAVAPHWGAWIEIQRRCASLKAVIVAPHWGAWIEIGRASCLKPQNIVAPHWGAWIEIIDGPEWAVTIPGRTPLGCVD